MSKSNAVEIIGVLWLIAAILVGGWLRWLFVAMSIENVIESMFYSFKEH